MFAGLRVGMPSLLELDGIEAQVETCRRLSLDFVELNMNLPWCVPGRLDPAVLRAAAAREAAAFTLHLPEETDLAAFQPRVLEGYRRLCSETLRWAQDSGVSLLNMHLLRGVYFTLPQGRVWLYERYEREFRATLGESLRSLDAEARRRGVLLCLENTGDWDQGFVARAVEDLLASTGVGLTWDTGHEGAAGFRDRELLARHSGRIRHVHLHDFRQGRSHLALGSGDLDLAGALAVARRQEARVVVETKTLAALESSLALIRRP
jgi:sugar phosphate isomerase/epimerase